jgi:lysophospholipase L1-like esterase
MSKYRLLRRAALAAACAGTVVAGVALPSVASFAASPSAHPDVAVEAPVVAGTDYLALGDSVTFGYRESNTSPAPDYQKAYTFVGYPKNVGAALDLHVANASCPGETSGSLVSTTQPSFACENSYSGTTYVPIGYRTLYPLHESYTGTQLAYGLSYLEAHRRTTLVSLMIGANDGFRCEALTKDDCKKEIGGVLKQIEANVTTALTSIRDTAKYSGQIVIVNYYSVDYANAADDQSSEAVNAAVDGAAAPFGVEIANGYRAFALAADHSGGNTCRAGLLTQLPKGQCGVHPSVAGQDVLAQAVMAAIKK